MSPEPTAEELAAKRDELRRNQVHERKQLDRLADRIKDRSDRIKALAARIRKAKQAVVMSAKGLAFLAREEGTVLHTYNDSAGHCTSCTGHLEHLGGCTSSQTFSPEQCRIKLQADVKAVEAALKAALHVPQTQAQKDALISLGFNIGTGGLTDSTVLRRINAKASAADIRAAFLMWVIPPELRGRREREVELYFTGRY
jgi:lysozyme